MAPSRPAAIVAGAFLAVAAAAAIWLALDRRPPEWDYANHLERGVLCARDLAHGELREVLLRSAFYPPLVPCLGGLAASLAPSDTAAGVAVVVAFLGLGMAATYRLGRRVAGSQGGIVAAVVFGTAPFTVWQALRFQLDVPLAAMVALALEALAGTGNCTRPGRAMLAGLVFGLGLLTKPPFVVYVLPPLALVLARARGRRALPGVLGFAAVGALIAVPWYGPRLLGLAAQIGARSFRQAAEQGHPEPLSVAGLVFYPQHLAVQLGAVGAALFVVGLAVCAARRAWWPLMALVPMVVFLAIQNKQLRYTLPLVPAAAAVAGAGFAALPPRARVAAGVALGAAALVQIGAATFGEPPAARLTVAGVPLAIAEPPQRAAWPHRDVLAAVVREAAGREATLSVVPNHPYFSSANFRYYAVLDRLPVRVVRVWDEAPLGVDFMVLKTGDVGPEFTASRPRRIAERLQHDAHLAAVFPVVARFALPDGSTATLRARRIPRVRARPATVAKAVEAALERALAAVARDVAGLDVVLRYDAGIAEGRLRRVEIQAAAATVGDLRRGRTPLRVREVRVVLEDVVVNPLSALAERRLDPLDIGRLRLERATISAPDLVEFVQGQKAFRRARLVLEDGRVTLDLPQRGPDVHARVRIEPAPDRPFRLLSEGVTLGGVAVPGPLVDWVVRHYDPSRAIAARAAFDVAIGPVRVAPDAIRIGAP